MDLYLDKYDYTSGTFIGMTDETQRQYKKDLENFYRVFTGNSDMPPTVQQFRDIKLKDFHKLEACSGPNAALRTCQLGEVHVESYRQPMPQKASLTLPGAAVPLSSECQKPARPCSIFPCL
jgi:hypothetical protein